MPKIFDLLSLLVALVALSGCARVAYQSANKESSNSSVRTPIKINNLPYALEVANIEIPAPITDVTALKKSGGIIDACVVNQSPPINAKNFSKCFHNVGGPVEVAAASTKLRFIVKPYYNSWPFSTAITGTAVGNSDYLYSSIAINSKDNFGTVLATVGGAVATGLTLGTPVGAAILGTAALVSTVYPQSVTELPKAPPQPKTLANFVCKSDYALNEIRKMGDSPISLASLSALKKPDLGLPASFSTEDVVPYEVAMQSLNNSKSVEEFEAAWGYDAPSSSMQSKSNDLQSKPGCWHIFPNTLQLSKDMGTSRENKKLPEGDGWFYRIIVPKDKNENASSGNLTSDGEIKKYILSLKPSRFPFSSCENDAMLQIIWWKQLSLAQNYITGNYATGDKHARKTDKPTISYVLFLLPEYPNPHNVSLVQIPRSGATIYFKRTCGVTASSQPDPTFTKDWGVLDAQMINLQKAVKAYQKHISKGS